MDSLRMPRMGLIEYALVLVLIALVVMGILTLLGNGQTMTTQQVQMAGEAATGTTKQVFVDGLPRDITVSPDRRRIEVQSPQTNNGHLVLSTNVTEDGCNISVSGMQAKSMFGIPPDECTVTNSENSTHVLFRPSTQARVIYPS